MELSRNDQWHPHTFLSTEKNGGYEVISPDIFHSNYRQNIIIIRFLLLRWGFPYRVKTGLELKILLPQHWDYRHTRSITSGKCGFLRTWGYSSEVRCFQSCWRPGVQFQTQKAFDQGKTTMGELFVSDNYFLHFLSCYVTFVCVSIYAYVNIYIHKYI